MTTDKAREIAARLTRGEKLHLDRLATSNGPLVRRSGWKARNIMVKGLSEWDNYYAGTERLTPLGFAVRAVLMEGDSALDPAQPES